MEGLKEAGVSVVCYLPDSLLKKLYPAIEKDPDIRAIPVTNEGEGAAICGGVVFEEGDDPTKIRETLGLTGSHGDHEIDPLQLHH